MSQGSPQPLFSETRTPQATDLGRFDVVRVRHAPPGSGLEEGEEGTIVEIVDRPDRAYLVDFSGGSGAEPHADDPVHTLTGDQIALVIRFRR